MKDSSNRIPLACLAGIAAKVYGDRLHRFLVRRMGSNAADDLAQEVYVRLLHVPLNEFIREPERYIFTVARRVVGEFARRERRQRSALRIDSHQVDHFGGSPEQFTVDEPAHWASSDEFFESYFNELPPEQQAALLLHLDGVAFIDIASRLEVSERAARRYVEKARDQLRSRLSSDGHQQPVGKAL